MLSKTARRSYFSRLGLGEYTKANILKLQKAYFPEKCGIKNNWDGIYGNDTDILLVNLYNVFTYAPHFKLTEFACHCGGSYCTGYPAILDKDLLKNLERIRVEFGVTNVSSGLRCKKWNSKQTGSSSTSKHIKGKAADIYGTFTRSSNGRFKVKKFFMALSNSSYCYYGTPNMGSAVHVDVK